MTLRFLQSVASSNPDVPFQPGQVITVAELSPYFRSLLDGHLLEVVATDDTERAVEPTTERPEPVRSKKRRRT